MNFPLISLYTPNQLSRCVNLIKKSRYSTHIRMNIEKACTYEGSIKALNSLQSNVRWIKSNNHPDFNIPNATKHLNRLGIQVEDLNSLNIIHVSGTKGKGSTCALTESILRHHGLKTGFYSSPHLIYVNERIRINGEPIPKDLFASYFWNVYDTLHQNLGEGESMPPYFMFLTVMSFYVFIKEKVDVAILEVGIGGLYDCTNVIRKPIAVGVTTLDLDHTAILGNTLPLIAEQKAGIFKTSVPAFTVPQPTEAMDMLKSRAKAIDCPFAVVPPFETYKQELETFNFDSSKIVQNENASLALQLSRVWLLKQNRTGCSPSPSLDLSEYSSEHFPTAKPFSLTSEYINGLKSCHWPGRFQTVEKGKFTFYLDGAHTQQSMQHCARWFKEVSQSEKANNVKSENVFRVLIFNCIRDRKAEILLEPISKIRFDLALFSPNRLSEIEHKDSDQTDVASEHIVELNQCRVNENVWCQLIKSSTKEDLAAIENDFIPHNCNETGSKVFSCLGNSLKWLMEKPEVCSNNIQMRMIQAKHVQVLVTGSIHLVGAVLSVLDSNS